MKSLLKRESGDDVEGTFSNLRFTDDIVLFSKSITEAETMLKELGSREADRTANQPEEDSVHEECLLRKVGKRIGLRINRKKTQFEERYLRGSGNGIKRLYKRRRSMNMRTI
ncbi:unnamed protein product [Strongylus vulgaris]|uniref:Reverse transcriptase domain-containing protein n=1 Tax=Strongylus vulgaris TaxID=40348 RepID=A0A3P7LXZ3_STRVU|nr:unnamed protein product [Strongylus vulgaris]